MACRNPGSSTASLAVFGSIWGKRVFLDPGEYTYRLTYKIERQIGFFEEFDELYWNVTGNGWEFPIERARATVVLPAGARVTQQAAYTGPLGATGNDSAAETDGDGNPVFATTRILSPGEGLTVAVAWPKGIVTEARTEKPPEGIRAQRSPKMAPAMDINLIRFGVVAVVLAYFLGMWLWVGRDPEPGVVIPLFEPPENISAPAARYVLQQGFDERVFSAAVLDLAVKGHLTISQNEHNDYVLTPVRGSEALPAEYKTFFWTLFPEREPLDVYVTSHKILKKANRALRKALAMRWYAAHFSTNGLIIISGAFLSGISLIFYFQREDGFSGFMAIVVGVMLLGVYKLAQLALAAMRQVTHRTPSLQTVGWLYHAGRSSLFALVSIFMVWTFLKATGDAITFAPIVLGAIVFAINYLFFELLKAPTRAGRRLMDRIEGFRMYLGAAEQPRLDASHPPEQTPELFEKYLPYAQALDVSTRWAGKFQDLLDTAVEGEAWRPSWWQVPGGARSLLNGMRSGASFGDEFASAIAAASMPPASGGGGSSGGGGGGGGGGGW